MTYIFDTLKIKGLLRFPDCLTLVFYRARCEQRDVKADRRMNHRTDLTLLSLGQLIREREMRKVGFLCMLDCKMQLEKQNNLAVMHQWD